MDGEQQLTSFFATGDWRRRLETVLETVRAISGHSDPQQMLAAYLSRVRQIIPMDRTISLSRRDLKSPEYRITRSDLWKEPVDPWKHRDRLPLLRGGLLADLIYTEEPRIIEDVHISGDEPAAEYLVGMRSLVAIPHFDDGAGLNMVIHMRREPAAFPVKEFPEFVLLSNLFGRAMHNLVLHRDLKDADDRLRAQYQAVSQLGDTVLEQAVALRHQAQELEERVRQRTAELEAANLDAIYMLALASEAKDEDTGRHLRRMQELTRGLASELGLSDADADALGYASILHDVGKMHVPDAILKKPGPLDDQERQVMYQHTVAGERILAGRSFFETSRRVARSHHENWDGTGYPDGIGHYEIPLSARIVHLADVFDALTSPRVYKKAWPEREATEEILRCSGTMFDPDVVAAFQRLRARQGIPDKYDAPMDEVAIALVQEK